MESYKLPKQSVQQIRKRDSAIDSAMKKATNIPFQTLTCCREIMNLVLDAAQTGNSNCISDAGVAGEMAHAGAHGAALNILINLKDIRDTIFCQNMEENTSQLLKETDERLVIIRDTVKNMLNND